MSSQNNSSRLNFIRLEKKRQPFHSIFDFSSVFINKKKYGGLRKLKNSSIDGYHQFSFFQRKWKNWNTNQVKKEIKIQEEKKKKRKKKW